MGLTLKPLVELFDMDVAMIANRNSPTMERKTICSEVRGFFTITLGGCTSDASRYVPHLKQRSASVVIKAPQLEHLTNPEFRDEVNVAAGWTVGDCGWLYCVTALPHAGQNFASTGSPAPQFVHVIAVLISVKATNFRSARPTFAGSR